MERTNFSIVESVQAMALKQVSDEEIANRQESGSLDSFYVNLVNYEEKIKRLKRLYCLGNSQFSRSFNLAIENVSRITKRIIIYYRDYFRDHPYLGDGEAMARPDLIIVLGANHQQLLEERAGRAAEEVFSKNVPCVLVSGGGVNALAPEAHYLRDILIEKGVERKRILNESDSMDTIGNALFSYFVLQGSGKLPNCKNIVIVTSDFHSLRTQEIFHRVFDAQKFNLAVLGSQSHFSEDRLLALADGQLRSEALAMESLFSFREVGEEKPIQAGDGNSLLLNMFLSHKLYQSREDLVRKYVNH